MTDTTTPDDALQAAARSVGQRATEAFAVLGNETRLAILLALWEAYEPHGGQAVVSFSTLRERVGVSDSGQFNYHLRKLEDRFVRRTDEGYVLRPAGRKIVRAVVAGVGVAPPDFEVTTLEKPCPVCAAPSELVYDDEWLYHACSECEGFFGTNDAIGRGVLSATEVDTAAFANRTPEAVMVAAWLRGHQELQSAIEGVCIECSGPVERGLRVCSNHDPDGLCAICGNRFAAVAKFRCTVCKNHQAAPPRTLVLHHPAVIGFYWDHGVSLLYGDTDPENHRARSELVHGHRQEILSTDPPAVRVTVEYKGDSVSVTFDEDLEVVETADAA